MAHVYIALGSNLGDRRACLDEALRRLAPAGRLVCASSYYETDPVGYLEQGRFLNAAAHVVTDLIPHAFLGHLLTIEAELGRVRTIRNGPRTIDLDILFWDQQIIDEPGLVVPHPRLHERLFVLEPLNEIAPDLMHPRLNLTVRALLERVRSASV